MGADLIGVGFTHTSDVECTLDPIAKAIDMIPDETFRDEAFLSRIDPSGGMDSGDPEHVDYPDYVRDFLKSGADEYIGAVSGHRSIVDFLIPGTSLWFVFAGGQTWGDDPFDGFTDLCYFVELCGIDPGIAQLAGFVCGGLPSPKLAAEYPVAVA